MHKPPAMRASARVPPRRTAYHPELSGAGSVQARCVTSSIDGQCASVKVCGISVIGECVSSASGRNEDSIIQTQGNSPKARIAATGNSVTSSRCTRLIAQRRLIRDGSARYARRQRRAASASAARPMPSPGHSCHQTRRSGMHAGALSALPFRVRRRSSRRSGRARFATQIIRSSSVVAITPASPGSVT